MKTTHTPDIDGQGDHYENCGFPAKECHCLALIAAAPDLLAACKSVAEMLKVIDGDGTSTLAGVDLLAAIRKAEGR